MRRTWTSADRRAPWTSAERKMTQPLAPLHLGEVQGVYLLPRYKGRPAGRLLIGRSAFGAEVPPAHLKDLMRNTDGRMAMSYGLYGCLTEGLERPAPPPLTISNRAVLLRRTLDALVHLRGSRTGDAVSFEIMVVDKAAPDDSTREAVAEFAGIRYAMEPVPGLDFRRNRALRQTNRPYLGVVDDNADHGWLDGFAEIVRLGHARHGMTDAKSRLVSTLCGQDVALASSRSDTNRILHWRSGHLTAPLRRLDAMLRRHRP